LISDALMLKWKRSLPLAIETVLHNSTVQRDVRAGDIWLPSTQPPIVKTLFGC